MLKSLRVTLNEIMAMAVMELFPGTILGNAKITATQFSYQFQFTQKQHPELLPLVEEKMRAILKSHPLIECIEMATNSAINYFEHHEQPYKVDLVSMSEETIIPLIRIGKFYDLMTMAPCLQLPELAFKLIDAKEGEWIEIIGTAFSSKEELKAFIKQRKLWLKEKPWEEGIRKELMTYLDETLVLLPKGVEILHQLETLWRSQIQKQGLLEVSTGNSAHLYDLSQYLRQGVAEWGMSLDLCIIPGKSCISSLQFIQQTFKMLELNAKWVVGTKCLAGVHAKQWEQEIDLLTKALEECGFPYSIDPDSCRTSRPTVELRILDSIGEEWPGPFLSFERSGSKKSGTEKGASSGEVSLVYSLFGPIKRLIALLAELNVSPKAFNVGES